MCLDFFHVVSKEWILSVILSVLLNPTTSQAKKKKDLIHHVQTVMMEVTDGWYRIWAKPDPALQQLIDRKKIKIGRKIITTGAELAGSHDSCSPLEVTFIYWHLLKVMEKVICISLLLVKA